MCTPVTEYIYLLYVRIMNLTSTATSALPWILSILMMMYHHKKYSSVCFRLLHTLQPFQPLEIDKLANYVYLFYLSWHTFIFFCMYVCMCVCVCVCWQLLTDKWSSTQHGMETVCGWQFIYIGTAAECMCPCMSKPIFPEFRVFRTWQRCDEAHVHSRSSRHSCTTSVIVTITPNFQHLQQFSHLLSSPSPHALPVHLDHCMYLVASSGSQFVLRSPPPCIKRSHLTRHL